MIREFRITKILALCVLALSISCSKKSAKKAPSTTPTPYAGNYPPVGGGGTGDPLATSSLSGSVEIISQAGFGSQLTAYVGQPVYWTFTARDSTSKVPISEALLSATVQNQPASMRIEGQNTSSLRITWTPQQNEAQTGSINITASGNRGSTPISASQTFTWQLSQSTGVIGGIGGGGMGGILAQALPTILQMLTGGDTSSLGSLQGILGGGAIGGLNTTPLTGVQQPATAGALGNINPNLINSLQQQQSNPDPLDDGSNDDDSGNYDF